MNRESHWGAVGTNFEPSEEGQRIGRKVAVLGHSLIRDLSLPTTSPLGEREQICYRKFCVPGATTSSLRNSRTWKNFARYKLDLTFLCIGGNDITAQSSPVDIARAIITLAKEVKEITKGEERIVTIERRPVPRGVSQICYSRQRNSVNRYLKHRDTFTKEWVIFS